METNISSRIAAVTGASGFIGSHVCQNLLEHGYTVRACVRTNHPSKVGHLLALAKSQAVKAADGRLEVCVADMSIPGAYDEIFGNGCHYVFHVAGNFGTDYNLWKSIWKSRAKANGNAKANNNGRLPPMHELRKEIHGTSSDEETNNYSYDHAVYESYVVAMEWLLQSVAKHKTTLQRVVYTSSGAAGGIVRGPALTKDDNILEDSYSWAKHDCEAMLYDFCQKLSHTNLIGVAVCPCIVMGPMMGQPPMHDSVYQHRMADMLRGNYTLRQHWEITDVRDVAEVHRLTAEAPHLHNGTRFWNGSERSWWVSDILRFVTNHEKFCDGNRFSPIYLSEDDEGNSGSESKSGNEDNNDDDNDDGDDKSEDSSSSSSPSSSSSGDSFGISDWDGDEHCTTWSDPVTVLSEAGYKPKTPEQTVLDTAASILERWEGHGRELSIQECSDYYTVAEMDGCDEEMEWLANQIRSKTATSST